MSKLGQEIIGSLKEAIERLEQGGMLMFASREEAQEFLIQNPDFKGQTGYYVSLKRRDRTRVDQTPPKPYNAVIEATED